MKPRCPICRKIHNGRALNADLGPDPLERIYFKLGRTGYFSDDDMQTVVRSEPSGRRVRRGRFNNPQTL